MNDLEYQAQWTLERILPELEARHQSAIRHHPAEWREFRTRLDELFPRLFATLYPLYGSRYDLFYYLEQLLDVLAHSWISRTPDLKELDRQRLADPGWFHSEQMVGAVCYVDLYAGDLKSLRRRIPYFQELGITYLHLMPLFRSPAGENDGGYAISSYREVDPRLGTIQDLARLARELRGAGISLVLDFVFNHTSSEHDWALKARAGDPHYRDYYFIYPDRVMPDAYEEHLREIFPDEHPGAFTYFEALQRWVWTTFHSYQWDLNYQNPAVFVSMAEEMLRIANLGVEVLRLDAVAFIWKELGNSCENLPQAHQLIRAFNLVARIAAPALVFKSEAIVHPDEVVKYISPQECQVSYNPLLMALLWESLATRRVALLRHSMQKRLALPAGTTWVNYIRCHDDIGWTFSDDDARELGINGTDHRRFLNEFYRGRFLGSFARGLPFQENPKTGDCRISGTCASLAGLEKAQREETGAEVDLALRRICLLHGIILTIGGIPLFYLGDEIGMLNDYSYREDPVKSGDSRWVHRPSFKQKDFSRRRLSRSIEGRLYRRLQALVRLRKGHPAFASPQTEVLSLENPSVFGFVKEARSERITVLANFSEEVQPLLLSTERGPYVDLLSGREVASGEVQLDPYQIICLAENQPGS